MMFYFGITHYAKTEIYVVITAVMKYERASSRPVGPPFGPVSKAIIVMDRRILFVVMSMENTHT